jgi:predicted nucleic acid-binding protein
VPLDDLKGRRIASLSGLEVTGSLGILIQAKQVGRPASVELALEQLKQRVLGCIQIVVNKALELAGESPTSSL